MKSKQPRKQRKARTKAKLHQRQNKVSAHLSKELSKKYKKKNIPLRKGDTVKIMRGEFKGLSGKVEKVDLKNYKVTIDGVKKRKVKGEELLVPLPPSNLLITELELKDKERLIAIERGVKSVE